MKEPDPDEIRRLLPELFGPADRKKGIEGLCTPGSGCGPEHTASGFDIVKMLTEKDRPSSGEKGSPEQTGNRTESGHEVDKA